MTLASFVSHRWPTTSGEARNKVRQLIGGLDDHLSRSHGVKVFSTDERCILRYALVAAPCDLRLSDGVEIRRGDPVIDVHCWNGRVPPMPAGGPDLAWAQATANRFRQSLRLLAEAAMTNPDLRHATACRARVNFVGLGCSNASVSRIIHRMGFEDVDEGTATLMSRFHDQLENLLIAALVWTHNPEALRRDKMIRERRPVWASRARLLAYHGAQLTPTVSPESWQPGSPSTGSPAVETAG